jgi:hypothetical protein
MARKFRISILTALLIVAFVATQVLAAPSIRFTLNGAKEAYNAGSVFMLYGRAEDSGLALPDADVLVKVDSGNSPVYWSQIRTDSNGYFKTDFNLPYSGVGSNLRVAVDAPGSNIVKQYALGQAQVGLEFKGIGFKEKINNQRVPVNTREIILVFGSNVNYFHNKSADSDLRFLGRNEKNADCARLYEKDTGKRISTSARLVSNDAEGDQQISFYKLDGTQVTEMRKRILPLSINETLSANTTYRVVISREMAANNSSILGADQVIEFTTEATSVSPKGEEKTPVVDQTISTSGGTVSEGGVTIVIPADAVSSDIKVIVEKVINTSALPIDNNSQFVSDVVEIIKDKSGNFSKPVTISLTFDKSKVDTTKYDLSICYLDEKENKWIPLDNVEVDLDTGIVSGEVLHFTKFAVIATEKAEAKKEEPVPVGPGKVVNLSDIKGHWAEKTIAELVASGAIAGYPDGTFKPDNTISRAEFATILVKAFNLESRSGKVFNDTAGHWAQDTVSTAAAHGIVSGYSDTTFGPNDPITREQMAVMIVKAAKLAEAQEGKTFADGDKVSAWAKNAVATASEKNIISGYPDNTFRPQNNATRAEAATVIIKSLKPAS